MIAYLHGFNSSGDVNNDKVIALQKIDDVHVVSYDSFDDAQSIIESIAEQVEHLDDIVFVGTSMGGFFAAQLALKFDVPSILINPLYKPEENLKFLEDISFLNYVTGEENSLDADTIASYESLPDISKANRFQYKPLIIMAKDDEVIPYEAASEYFKNHNIISKEKGGHRFNDLSTVISDIVSYLNHVELTGDIN